MRKKTMVMAIMIKKKKMTSKININKRMTRQSR